MYLSTRPCKALPPGPQAAPLPPDPLRPAAFWKKLPPTSKNSEPLPVQGVTSVMKMAPSSGKRMACAPHCFSLPTGCMPLLWPRPKARPSGTICPLRIRLLVDFPGCTPFLADIRRGIRRKFIVLDNRAGLAARSSINRGRGISEVTALSCGDSLSLLKALVWMVLMYCRLCSVLSLHMSPTGGRGYSHK